MASPAVIFEEDFSIPAGVADLGRFRQWSADRSFPQRGRIDFLQGTVEVDSSPEDLYTHGVVKTAIASELHQLIAKANRGFEVLTLGPRGYGRQAQLAAGRLRSPLLGRAVRLTRKLNELARWEYELKTTA